MYGTQQKTEEGKIASDLLGEVSTKLSNWGRGHVAAVGHENLEHEEDDHNYFYIEGRGLPRDFGDTDLPSWAEWSHSHDGGPYDHREVVTVDRKAWKENKDT